MSMGERQRPRRSDEPYDQAKYPIETEPPILGDRPHAAEVVARFKDRSLGEYLLHVREYLERLPHMLAERPPIDRPADITDALYVESERLFGTRFGRQLHSALGKLPMFYSGPHAGLETDAIETQGAVFLSTLVPPRGIFPVLATNNIPLNNSSIGRGIVLSRKETLKELDENGRSRQKNIAIPLFPNKYATVSVARAPRVTSEMFQIGFERARALWAQGRISAAEWQGLQKYFSVCTGRMLQSHSFEDLAAHWNRAAWPLMFSDEFALETPDLAFFSMEKVLRQPMIEDIRFRPDSLITHMLFNPTLQKALLEKLDKAYGCWDRAKLDEMADEGISKHDMKNAGTVWFWDIRENGKEEPLRYVEYDGLPYLESTRDPHRRIPFTKESILAELEAGNLNPNLFLSYAFIAFARGFLILGGTKQADYLKRHKEGLVEALRDCGYTDWADNIDRYLTDAFATSLTTFMAEYEDGALEPAGAVELIAHGGVTMTELEASMKIEMPFVSTFWVATSVERRAARKFGTPVIDLRIK